MDHSLYCVNYQKSMHDDKCIETSDHYSITHNTHNVFQVVLCDKLVISSLNSTGVRAQN